MKRQLSHWAVFGAMLGLLLLFGWPRTASADAPSIHNFSGTDGSGPQCALVQSSDGNFYGTTYGGGSGNFGTIFKMTPAGALTTLFSFSSADGAYPTCGLTLGSDGSFYGTTAFGGGSNKGTLFRLTTDGTAAGTTLTTLVTFTGPNGNIPYAPLIQATDGSFYGTTVNGGANDKGSLFKVTTDGTAAGTTLTTLVSLVGPTYQHPYAGLVQGRDGNFYGATWDGANGWGRLFKLTTDGTPAGSSLISLASFKYSNGANTPDSLILGKDGNFYGTTYQGGTNSYYGTVFKLKTDGTQAGSKVTVLVSFVSRTDPHGAFPHAGLIQGSDGSFYGTTQGGGSSGNNGEGYGTVFKVTTDGTAAGSALTTLVVFNGSNGATPYAPLTQGLDGSYYGTTLSSGVNAQGFGTVYKIGAAPGSALSYVTASPSSIVGGSANASGAVALVSPTSTAVTVTLTSSDPAVLSVRPSVTVTAGHRMALFTAVSHPVTATQVVTITAVANGVTKTTTVTVTP